MKKVVIALLVLILIGVTAIAVLLFTGFSVGKKDEGPKPEDVTDQIIAAADEISLDVVPAAQEALKEYLEEKEDAEEEKRKEEEEEEDDDDPMNEDSTADTGQNTSAEGMMQRYIGRWEQQGVIQSDGNIDSSTGAHCTYIFNADKTYTAKGVDVSGNKIDEQGTWSLNAKKQIVAGQYTMGIDESGYLLKDTGERDGRGRKMKYAFSKVS